MKRGYLFLQGRHFLTGKKEFTVRVPSTTFTTHLEPPGLKTLCGFCYESEMCPPPLSPVCSRLHGLILYDGSWRRRALSIQLPMQGVRKWEWSLPPQALKFFLSHTPSHSSSFLRFSTAPFLLHGTRADEYLWLCFSLHQAKLAGGSLWGQFLQES